MSDVNPVLPTSYHVWWTVSVVAYLLLVVVGVVSLWRSRDRLTTTSAMLWTAAVVLFPALGSLAWLVVGRSAARRAAPTAP